MNKQMRPAVLSALVGVAVVLFATTANAAPIRFDNPQGAGHYDWKPLVDDFTHWLDVTLPASSQPGVADGLSAFQQQNLLDTAGAIHADNNTITQLQFGGVHAAALWPSAAGEVIPAVGTPPPNYNWNNTGFVFHPAIGSNMAEGVENYLGIRFDLGFGWQYGWIGVVRTQHLVDTFAWGYETEPGVPIAAGAPEPGSLALLAFGAVGVTARRHKGKRQR